MRLYADVAASGQVAVRGWHGPRKSGARIIDAERPDVATNLANNGVDPGVLRNGCDGVGPISTALPINAPAAGPTKISRGCAPVRPCEQHRPRDWAAPDITRLVKLVVLGLPGMLTGSP